MVLLPMLDRFRALGNAGAVANARRACEEHQLAMERADAVGRRLMSAELTGTPQPAGSAASRRRSA